MRKMHVALLIALMMVFATSCGEVNEESVDNSEYEAYIAELESENESLVDYANALVDYSEELISVGDEMLAELENALAENEELQAQLDATDSEEETTAESTVTTYDSVIYSDAYVDITFSYSTYGVAVFEFTNKCDDGVMWAGCDYITLDGVEYSYDDTGERSGWATDIATGDTRSYEVIMLAADSHEEIPAETFSTISGIFWYYVEDTDIDQQVNVPKMSIN